MADFDIVSKYLVQHYPDDTAAVCAVDAADRAASGLATNLCARGAGAAAGSGDVQSGHTCCGLQADCLAGMSLLSGLVYARETVAAILFEEGLMDMIRESPVAQYLTQQGIEQGIEQGSRERAIEDLLDVLEIRFALDAAEPLADRIRGIEDSQRLKQLHRAAVQVESLEAFQSLLDADE